MTVGTPCQTGNREWVRYSSIRDPSGSLTRSSWDSTRSPSKVRMDTCVRRQLPSVRFAKASVAEQR